MKQLERFDANLRVVWGFGLGKPFPGWVIERRIPDHMKAKVYGDKPSNRTRFSDQWVVDEKGKTVVRRSFDMMPDYHPVYRVIGDDGQPILDLGEHVIDYLRKNYTRTLLGFPELSLQHHREDQSLSETRKQKQDEQLWEDSSLKVMEHKTDVFPESFHFGGQPSQVKEGSEL